MFRSRLLNLFPSHQAATAFVVVILLGLFTTVLVYAGIDQLAGKVPSMGVTPVTPAGPDVTKAQRVTDAYGRMPISFEANRGQTDGQVKFLSRGSGYILFLTATEAVLTLRERQAVSKNSPHPPHSYYRGDRRDLPDPVVRQAGRKGSGPERTASTVLRMKLVGANKEPGMKGFETLPSKSNYFIGEDRKKWRTNIPQYAKVKYESVYSGIDLVFYGNQRQLEYDFIVAPGADPGAIRLAFQGADKLSIDENGNLILHAAGGEVIQYAPRIYQEVNGVRKPVAGHYVLFNPETLQPAIRNSGHPTPNPELQMVGFQVAAYDTGSPLIIDPVLSYSTYLGGSSSDNGYDIVVDTSGNAYLTGYTYSTDFPTSAGAYDTSCGTDGTCDSDSPDIIVAKIAPSEAGAASLIYSTYLGGNNTDYGIRIDVDSSGNAYVTGITYSNDFPTTQDAYQSTFGSAQGTGADVYITKLSSDGTSLLYSTYLGGSSGDGAWGIAVDITNNIYVTGGTYSTDFPTSAGAYDTTCGTDGTCNDDGTNTYIDLFVTKIDPSQAGASQLVYSTYLGGSGKDYGFGLTLDSSDNVYVTGDTDSTDFPTSTGAFDTSCGSDGTCDGGLTDAFVTKIDPSQAGALQLVYSTYLGGNDKEFGYGIKTNGAGNVYVTGGTYSTDFPTSAGAFDTTCGTDGACNGSYADAFVTKIDSTEAGAASLSYSTYLGGSFEDNAYDLAVDTSDNAYVTGFTYSSDFPISNPFQGANGGAWDGFVTKLNATGSSLVYSSYLGGSNTDAGYGIAVDSSNSVYVTGETYSGDFTTVNPYQDTISSFGYNDLFVVKIIEGDVDLSITKTDSADPVTAGNNLTYTVTVTNNGSSDAPGVTINDTLPANVTFVSATPDQGSCSESGGTVTCNIGTLATGNTAQVEIVVTPTVAGMITNTASVMAYASDPDMTNNTATEDTCSVSLSDISGHWAEDYIKAIYCAGITTGYGDGTYSPDNSVDRAEMAAFIIRALYGETFSYSGTPYFPDIPDTHWAFKYIQRLYEDGITTGYGDGTYRPTNMVNRAEMAAFIIRALYGEAFTYSPTPYFPDVSDTHWAFKYIQRLYEDGITTGYGDGTYRPANNVTRAEMAAFLARAFLGM